MMTLSKKHIATIALAIVAVVVGFMVSNHSRQLSSLPESIRDVAIVPAINLQTFNLYDHNEDELNLESLKGQWTLVSFGFTYCPDVCPATLSQMATLYRSIKDQKSSVILPQLYFVSVDPDRDTPAMLKGYTQYFDSSFIGASGNTEDLLAFEKQFGVFHRYIYKPGDQVNYTVEHSAEIFLIDPQGRIVAVFRPPMNIKQVVNQYADFVGQYTRYES